MEIRTGVEAASLTDIGCQRDDNEDYLVYWESDSDQQLQHKGRLAIVADGMGGHEGGQEASRLAVESIEEVYLAGPDGDPQALLLAGFGIAHQRIQEYAHRNPKFHGMGTTATAVAIFPQQLFFAHIGDSRLYLVRDSNISRLTQDHSYVARLVENGVITPEEADEHPQRHILTAALGAGPETLPDLPSAAVPLRSSDVLVLCTDGLWSLLDDSEILEAAASNPPILACRKLVDRARQLGGPDNITVQVIRIS